MELIFWWMPIAWALLAAVAAGVTVLVHRRGRRRAVEGRAIAHSDRLTALPGYRAALARYRTLLLAFAGLAALVLVAGVTLASRPVATSIVYPQLSNRDIVLCLDVSGSMVEYDTELVEVFGQLVDEFEGERVSLVVFNASAVTYFPLTADYDYIREQFATITEQFVNEDIAYFDGTFFGDGSSLIGDGLAACSLRFDTPEEDRSRSIILATDNLAVGESIFTLPEAGELASEAGIRVYGINPGDSGAREYLARFAAEFRGVIEGTGGSYFGIDDPRTIESIVERIDAEQATISRGAPQLVQADQPALPVVLAFLGLAGLIALAWRLQR